MFEVSDSYQFWAIFGLVVVMGFYIQRIDKRQRQLNARLGRLSLTFKKIENDLNAIQGSILILAKNDGEAFDRVAKIRDRRPVLFRHIVEQMESTADILRGLERPDKDDDPNFWKGNLADRMQLPKDLAEARGSDDLE